MDICLDLSAHCIETELKRIYNKAVAGWFKADEPEKTRFERIIEAVRQLLETIDFSSLRSTYPALAGGTEVKAALSIGKASSIITVGDTEISLI